jgi:large subunit ribosomal protein L29
MKDLKLKDNASLKKLDAKTLKEELTINSKKLFELSMKKSLGELKQTHLIKALRRYIARIKTIARENDFNIG